VSEVVCTTSDMLPLLLPMVGSFCVFGVPGHGVQKSSKDRFSLEGLNV
jgi:hypothetical protein